MGVPVDGIKGGRGPSVAIAEIGGDDRLAGGVEQGFAELASDADVVSCQVDVAEWVL